MKYQKLLCIFPLFHLNTVLCAIKCPTHVSGYQGTEGIISCFVSEFKHLYWFEKADGTHPLIRLDEGDKRGRGLDNGEYDILKDGSLVMNNITFSNDQQYEIKVSDFEDKTEMFVINFSVIACDKICPPENGQVNQNASFAQFTCDDGFHLDSQHSNTLECKCESRATNSCSWSELPPTCVRNIIVDETSNTDTNALSTPMDVTTQHITKVTTQSMKSKDKTPHCAFACGCVVGFVFGIVVGIFATKIPKIMELLRKICATTGKNTSSNDRSPKEDTNEPSGSNEGNETQNMETTPRQSNATTRQRTDAKSRNSGKESIEKKANESESTELSSFIK